jgi:hypothetical protein
MNKAKRGLSLWFAMIGGFMMMFCVMNFAGFGFESEHGGFVWLILGTYSFYRAKEEYNLEIKTFHE